MKRKRIGYGILIGLGLAYYIFMVYFIGFLAATLISLFMSALIGLIVYAINLISD